MGDQADARSGPRGIAGIPKESHAGLRKKQATIALSDIPRVGPGTPAGEWFRRYWLAVGTSKDLREIPLAIKVLDEQLVLFRDRQGRPGLLALHCAHRGSSLEYGDIEENGIRCAYHGWLFDVSGTCLEQPTEPTESMFTHKVKQLSYPVRELGGLIFAYLGPDPGVPPPLPKYSPLMDCGGQRQIEPTRYFDYNWLNFYENAVDPAHICVLHRHSGYGEQTWGDKFFSYEDMPSFDPIETEYGMKIVMRKPGPAPATEVIDEMSVAFPGIVQVGDTEFVHAKVDQEVLLKEGSHCEHTMFLTPNDDDHFMLFTVNYYIGPNPDFFAKLDLMRQREFPKQELKPYDRRKYMPYRGNIRQEDIVTQSTQGLLGERHEHLASSDRGVIMLRKLLQEAIKMVSAGGRPKGIVPSEKADDIVRLDSFVGIRPAIQT
jgi:phenylpropionate dioxygenase-like ring-hydroxylating dioxygenase large terminal subunit